MMKVMVVGFEEDRDGVGVFERGGEIGGVGSCRRQGLTRAVVGNGLAGVVPSCDGDRCWPIEEEERERD